MQFQTISGLSVHELPPVGEAQPHPILFIHGWWCGAWSWHKWMPLFSEAGYHCYAVTLRGHPTSKPGYDLGNISFSKHLTDAKRVFRALGSPIVCGHSMGGLITQKLAEKLDPPAAVVMTSAAPRGISSLSSPRVLTTLVRYTPTVLFSRPFLPSKKEMIDLDLYHLPKGERDAVYSQMTPAPGRQAREVALAGIPVDEKDVTCRILVVASTDDVVAPPAVSRRIRRKYGADYREYEDQGHFINCNPGWERTAQDVIGWLNQNTVNSNRQIHLSQSPPSRGPDPETTSAVYP